MDGSRPHIIMSCMVVLHQLVRGTELVVMASSEGSPSYAVFFLLPFQLHFFRKVVTLIAGPDGCVVGGVSQSLQVAIFS